MRLSVIMDAEVGETQGDSGDTTLVGHKSTRRLSGFVSWEVSEYKGRDETSDWYWEFRLS